jgi:DNA invertase Pin-like site-specific DNA recombinase
VLAVSKQRVLGYVRVSTAEQVEGFGLDIQRSKIREWAKSNNATLVAILADEGQSGSNGLDARQGLAEALARIERGDASALVVYRFDRLARDLALQETIHARLEAIGATVVSVTEPAATSDDATRTLMRQILGAVSQYERALIRGRMLSGKAAKKAVGGYVGGKPPYGFRAVGGELVPDERESELVALILRLREEGASYRAISSELSNAGYTTRRGTRFNPAQVRSMVERSSPVSAVKVPQRSISRG